MGFLGRRGLVALDMQELKINGTYKHYKGHIYKVFGVAKHSESLEDLVIYATVEAPDKLWARPKGMFLGDVAVDGQSIPRFKLIS